MSDLSPSPQCSDDPGAGATLVSAVVLTFQRQDLLRACLDSIVEAFAVLCAPTEIVVVDNGSPGNAATATIATSVRRPGC